jgi:type VI secretion system secreted protein Hcp
MKTLHAMMLLLALIAVQLVPIRAASAFQAYMRVEGTKHGVFAGESSAGRWQDSVPVCALRFEARAPRDAATGLPTGRTINDPVTITKEWGAASPLYFDALATNELLRSVVIQVVGTDPGGAERITHTLRLQDAVVVGFRQYVGERGASSGVDRIPLEDITFTYRSLELLQGGERGRRGFERGPALTPVPQGQPGAGTTAPKTGGFDLRKTLEDLFNR